MVLPNIITNFICDIVDVLRYNKARTIVNFVLFVVGVVVGYVLCANNVLCGRYEFMCQYVYGSLFSVLFRLAVQCGVITLLEIMFNTYEKINFLHYLLCVAVGVAYGQDVFNAISMFCITALLLCFTALLIGNLMYVTSISTYCTNYGGTLVETVCCNKMPIIIMGLSIFVQLFVNFAIVRTLSTLI